MKKEHRYKYYTNNKDVVVAVSTYAGKTVRGVAKLDPRDTFDLEKGKALASARCNEKIALKRAERARQKYNKAIKECEKLEKIKEKMTNYYNESMAALVNAKALVNITTTVCK